MTAELRVPTLGESIAEATVGNWFKAQGEAVAADEVVCELETDKVTVEVPAPQAGVLAEIVAPQGTPVANLAWSPEGNCLLGGDSDGRVFVCRFDTEFLARLASAD